MCPRTQRRLTGILSDGVVIDGKYRINAVIGTGGMAAVYRAEQLKIGRSVALKMLLPEFVAYPELVGRVEREARAAGGIDHANVVAILDLGSTPEYGPYIAMELLKGDELATYLERRTGRISPIEAADIARQVLAGLEAAHAKGVVHRDLKPENIFLARVDDDRLTVKVLDFGISKVAVEGSGLSSLTRTGTVLGTPQFMSPEQAAGARDQDSRVDIYACGTVLYAMLTNALPYAAENYNLLINEILNKPPTPILSRDPNLDPKLAAIVMRAIAKKPEHRFPTARAMNDALVAWLNENDPNRAGHTGGRPRVATAPTVLAFGAPGGPNKPPTNPGARRAAPRDPTMPLPRAPSASGRDNDEPTVAVGRGRVNKITSNADSDDVGVDDPTVAVNVPASDATPTALDVPLPAPDLEEHHTPPPVRTRGRTPPPSSVMIEMGDEIPSSVDPLESPPSLRSNTRTPLGWEHTPGGTPLPPRKRTGLWSFLVVLVLLGGGAFALRQFQPAVWNQGVGAVGLATLAVPDPAHPAHPTPMTASTSTGGTSGTNVHAAHGGNAEHHANGTENNGTPTAPAHTENESNGGSTGGSSATTTNTHARTTPTRGRPVARRTTQRRTTVRNTRTIRR